MKLVRLRLVLEIFFESSASGLQEERFHVVHFAIDYLFSNKLWPGRDLKR